MILRIFITITGLFLCHLTQAQTFVFFGVGPDTYEIKLLQKALETELKTPVQLKMFDGYIPKLRAFQLLQEDDGIDVIIGGVNKDRIKLAKPIYFPIFKGLYGLRVNLVNKQFPNKLKDITTIQQLSALTAGQFHTWSDTAILRHNGLTVADGSDVEGLYEMLHRNRFDYFPRSVLEVYWDIEQHPDLDLHLDKHILIKYQKPHYYFVNKFNNQLAKTIEAGLIKLKESGEHDRLFNAHYGQLLASLNLEQRHVIELENPFLPSSVTTHNESLWLDFSAKTTGSEQPAQTK